MLDNKGAMSKRPDGMTGEYTSESLKRGGAERNAMLKGAMRGKMSQHGVLMEAHSGMEMIDMDGALRAHHDGASIQESMGEMGMRNHSGMNSAADRKASGLQDDRMPVEKYNERI